MKPKQDTATQTEWQYRYEERLGILCASGVPTDEEISIATKEADEVIYKLNKIRELPHVRTLVGNQ